jgi:reverse gyrase
MPGTLTARQAALALAHGDARRLADLDGGAVLIANSPKRAAVLAKLMAKPSRRKRGRPRKDPEPG